MDRLLHCPSAPPPIQGMRALALLAWGCLFLLLVWIVGIAQITAPIQWLAILGTTLGTIAVFRENGTQMRLLMLSSSCCWVIHNLVIGSIGGAFIEGSFMLVNGSFLLRFARTRPCPANHS